MVEINLLPWRHYVDRRKILKRKIIIAGSIIVIVIILSMLQIIIAKKLSIQKHSLQDLQQKMDFLEQEQQTEQQLQNSEMELLWQKIKVNRLILFDYITALSTANQYEIRLTQFQYDARRADFVGFARTITELRCWLRFFSKQHHGGYRITLNSLKQKSDSNELSFQISILSTSDD